MPDEADQPPADGPAGVGVLYVVLTEMAAGEPALAGAACLRLDPADPGPPPRGPEEPAPGVLVEPRAGGGLAAACARCVACLWGP